MFSATKSKVVPYSTDKAGERDFRQRKRNGTWLSSINCYCLCLGFSGVCLAVLFLASIAIPLTIVLARSATDLSSTSTTVAFISVAATSNTTTVIPTITNISVTSITATAAVITNTSVIMNSTLATTLHSFSTTTSITTSTTSTTPFDSCTGLQWNQTGVIVAGTGSDTTNSNGFKRPSWLYIDANNTLYICDQNNNRVQMWTSGATNGTTIAGDSGGAQGTSSMLLKQPMAVTLDNNGFMYVSDQGNNRVQRYSPNSLIGTTVAGQASGTSSGALDSFKIPAGIAVDDNLNLYIADAGNRRIMLWAPNATSGSILISSSLINYVYGLLLASNSSNQVYMSIQGGPNSIYLWTFGASNPNLTLTQVNGNPNTLNNPSGIALDPYGNLYVADRDNNRVVMYCVNATIGTPVVNGTTPALFQPIAVGFDSNLNMLVLTSNGDSVVRYTRL